MKSSVKLITALACAAGMAFGSTAYAQDNTQAQGNTQAQSATPTPEKNFTLELNSARDNENGCRLTYVAFNGSSTPLDKTAYEVVVFDQDGGVSQFLILEFGKLPTGKTKVVQFDLKDKKCADISRLLINDVSECEAGGATVPICLDALQTTSRTNIGFGV